MSRFIELTESEVKALQKLSEKSEALQKVLEFLDELEVDAVKNSYITYSQKLLDINRAVKSATLDINDKDDKGFERVLKAMTETTKIAQTLKELEKGFLPEELKEIKESQRYGNIQQNWALRRKTK